MSHSLWKAEITHALVGILPARREALAQCLRRYFEGEINARVGPDFERLLVSALAARHGVVAADIAMEESANMLDGLAAAAIWGLEPEFYCRMAVLAVAIAHVADRRPFDEIATPEAPAPAK